jgi:glycosyltransferase involved in cell wall biosynthesis
MKDEKKYMQDNKLKTKRKVAIIGTVGLPSKYGGFETLTEYLTQYLSTEFDMTVYCSSRSYESKQKSHNGAKLEYINLNANGVQSIPYDIISISKALRYSDTLLILGVSGCAILPFVRLFSKKNIVVNIDGLEWKRAKWNKYAKWFLKFSEKIAVKYADTVVADNKVIQEYVLSEYSKNSMLIAYGADHVEKLAMNDAITQPYDFLQNRYAFTVCRIEPENNIHLILEAMALQTDLKLALVGNWDSSRYGRELRKEYNKYDHIYLIDPIYDQNLLNQIRSNCYVYLHGHSAGGTNPSLVEAMALGLPIVAYGINYNKATTNNKAIYFSNSQELVNILKDLRDENLSIVSKEMKKQADKMYTWDNITSKYASLF